VKRIDERTVELTEREQYLSDRFEGYLDEGYGIVAAMERVKETTEAVESIGGMGKTDPDFWEWLVS
jgi:hypothetical protein